MKTMKRFWTAICSFLFALTLGWGITLSVNVNAKAATENKMKITYGALQFEDGDSFQKPEKYAFVLDGLTTPESYELSVQLNGEEVPAYTVAGHGIIYVSYEYFQMEIGDVALLTIPAGTYYQSDAYTSNDYNLFLKNVGKAAENDTQYTVYSSATPYALINEAPYDAGLNMVDWALNASSATAIYIAIDDSAANIPYGGTGSDENWTVSYNAWENAVKVNGEPVATYITKTHQATNAYIPISGVSNAGDTVTIEGWFLHDTKGAFYINETTFIFDGQMWETPDTVSYDLEDSKTGGTDLTKGIYTSMSVNDIPVSTTNNGWSYMTSPCGEGRIKLNGVAIGGVLQKFSVGDWYVNIDAAGKTAAADDIVTVGGWFCCTVDGTQHFIKINPVSFTFDGTSWTKNNVDISVAVDGTETQEQYLHVSPGMDASAIAATAKGDIVTDTTVTTVYENGALADSKFVLREGESTSDYRVTFSVKDKDGVVYRQVRTVRVGFKDFVMESGAAVRVDGENVNGLRFSAEMNEDTYKDLKAQGATFGVVIVPRDYITDGYELTAANLFGENAKYSEKATAGANQEVRLMLHLSDLTPMNRDNDGKLEIYGAITDILTNNITREFVGVAYAYVNGAYVMAQYYENDIENNARSMYYVSQKAVEASDHAEAVQEKYIDLYDGYVADADATYTREYTVNYVKREYGKTYVETETYTAKLNEIVVVDGLNYYGDGYKLTSPSSITSRIYANKDNVFNFYYTPVSAPSYDSVAWYHPALDSSNGYDNATNDAIAQKMLAAGFTTVNMAGSYSPMLNNDANIEAVKNIINMFYRNGLKTVAYTHNAGSSGEANEMFGLDYLPDLYQCEEKCGNCGLCEGFVGFIVWDEPMPTTEGMERLVEYANWFVTAYGDAGSAVDFMVNLFPSYSATFESGDYTSYSAYIEAYCNTVLSVIGKAGLDKYLSMDSYPIMADGTLGESFLYDMAILKHYAMVSEAHAHTVLQVCGWTNDTESEEDDQNVAPTEAEMRMLLYSALAFGMDSVSWWGYEQAGPIVDDQCPNGSETVYNAITAVNAELASFGSIYKTYNDWKGAIMSSPEKSYYINGNLVYGDAQYNAFNMVKSDSLLSGYMLSASGTTHFSAISGSGSNHIVGVMQDGNGNEAYVAVNYSALEDNQTLSLTFTPTKDGTYVIYTKGGSQTVSMTTNGYTLTLEPGQGAFIVSASTTHTVTFQNEDGTVLQTLTGVAYGTTPEYTGETPTKDGYKFVGWTPTLSAITGDVVYTAQFVRVSTVTYINYDGTDTEKTEVVLSGSKITYTPTLDGYEFKGWTLNGEAYDTSKQVTEDITLTANWYKVADDKEKSVILTAEEVRDQTVRENAPYLAIDGIDDSTNDTTGSAWHGWYYDSDYLTAWEASPEKLLNRAVKYSTDATSFEHTIYLPKINYTLYSKVDFGYRSGGAVSDIKINGTAVEYKANSLVSVVTDENGTRVILYAVNEQPVVATIELSPAIARGEKALTLSFKSNGYMWLMVTQFHGTVRAIDYQAEMAEIAETVSTMEAGSDAQYNAVVEYYTYKNYGTAYEKAQSDPDSITAAKERKVTVFVANNSTSSEEYVVELGDTVAETIGVPTLDGYKFKGWTTTDGEVYDPTTMITGDVEIVATWIKLVDNGEKSVILTAEEVSAQTVTADGFTAKEIQDNDSWWFDTDYPDYGLGGTTTDSSALLAKRAQFLNGSAVAGTTYTLYLPKVNYTMYSKVDFAFQLDSAGGVSNVAVNGTPVAHETNRTFSVVTDENGTRLIVYLTMQPVSSNPAITVELTEAMATGAEAIPVSFQVSGYSYYRISQFHGTVRAIDYQAKMAEIAATVSTMEAGSDAQYNALVEYNTYKNYGTAYEKAQSDPDSITAAKANFEKRNILTSVTPNLTSNASNELSNGVNQRVMSGDSNNAYTFTLPKVCYAIYGKTELITVFGQANEGSYSISAYGTTFTKINNSWNWLVVVTAGAEGYTDGYGTNHGEGSFLIMGSTDYGTEWLTCVKLPDAVANGEEGLSFTVTTGGNWDWMKLRNSSAEEDSMLGTLR